MTISDTMFRRCRVYRVSSDAKRFYLCAKGFYWQHTVSPTGYAVTGCFRKLPERTTRKAVR